MSKDDFLTLKNSDDAWLVVLEKALWKEKQKVVENLGEKIKRIKETQINKAKIYDLSDKQLTSVRDSLK